MDFYLGSDLSKSDVKKTVPIEKVEPTDEVLIMLFTNINLKKLATMLLVNILLKTTMQLSWSDFISLSLMIIMMRHPAIRLAYYLFVGYLVDEVLLSILLCGFDFYDVHFDFVGEQFILNTTWYYLSLAYGTAKGIICSFILLFLNVYLERPLSLIAVIKQITLVILMYFIQILNIKRQRHPADPVFDQTFRLALYKDPKKLESLVNEYCQIISKSTTLKPEEKILINNLSLLRYIRALNVLISKADFEDGNSNMSQYFISCITTLAKAYNQLVPKVVHTSKVETLWKMEPKQEKPKNMTLDNTKCQLIEGISYLFRVV